MHHEPGNRRGELRVRLAGHKKGGDDVGSEMFPNHFDTFIILRVAHPADIENKKTFSLNKTLAPRSNKTLCALSLQKHKIKLKRTSICVMEKLVLLKPRPNSRQVFHKHTIANLTTFSSRHFENRRGKSPGGVVALPCK